MGNCCPAEPQHEVVDAVFAFEDPTVAKLDELINGCKKDPTDKITLRFGCSNLVLPTSALSKIDFDPVVVLYRCEGNTYKNPKEEFKTERVPDDPNPKFATSHTFDFKFEETTYFQARVYNEKVKDGKVENQELYGQMNFTLQDLIN
jgi:hypothetical protein